MITAPTYQDKRIGVFGLARSGLATVHSLVASGAKVFAWDDNEAAREQVRGFASDLYTMDFNDLDALVLAPGVPLTHPEPHTLVKKARACNLPIISDIEIFQAARATLPAHKTIGITGTNGKSTTTALVGHILANAGRKVAIGGNIGTGVLALEPLPNGGIYVFELSSFQLDLTSSFDSDVAVLLNISPDHLDRHGSMAGYIAAKSRLVEQQGKNGTAVIAVDDQPSREVAATCRSVVLVSSLTTFETGVSVKNGILIDDIDGQAARVGSLADVQSLQGAHNWQNAAAAYGACRTIGLSPEEIYEGLCNFPGLAHRQEIVPFRGDIRVVNDSKATNVDAATRALQTYDRIRWIAGGRAKDDDFSALGRSVGTVSKAYLMGEAARAIGNAMPSTLPVEYYPAMADAVTAAVSDAEQGDTILLSPACTAFDQFANFEKRGEAFKEILSRLPGDAV